MYPRAERHKLEETRLYLDRLIEGGAIQLADLAIVAVHRHLLFEPINDVESCDRGNGRVWVLPRVERDLELAGHRAASDAREIGLARYSGIERRVFDYLVDNVCDGFDGRFALQEVAASGLTRHAPIISDARPVKAA
jgi:hypothetical protein